jgi:Animal haem peroxidase
MLQASYPSWSDARVYNVARLINAAVMAKIHTVEWTPAILPNRTLNLAMNANWFGLIETVLHKRPERRLFRGLKIESHALGGIVGNYLENHGVPYGLSEEFTEVYRLHDLLPDALQIRRIGDATAPEHVDLAATRHKAAHEITRRVAMTDLFYSFGNQSPGQLVLNNYPRTLQRLSLPGNPVFDLAAVDILRARERGVPHYNEFRRQLGMNPIRTFEDLTNDPRHLDSLKRIYANDVEALDLLVGTRAETHRPTGYGFGETMFQIFILNASLRLQADRFYTTSFNAETYTSEGIEWIDRADFRAVLLRHYPQLIQTGLKNVDNAFEPWDTGTLGLDRHPLREFA